MRSSAPKRRLDVRQQPTTGESIRAGGKRVATRKRRDRSRFIPSPAMTGVAALLVAGVGSAVISTQAESTPLASGYQTISASYTGFESGTGTEADEGTEELDISRDFDRDLLAQQAEQQAEQRDQALAELVTKTQDRAEELQSNQWVMPVAGYRISARFGQSSSLWSTTHTGLDLSGPSGSTIVSVAAGTVKSVGYDGSYGNKTVIEHLDGTETWYAHQSRTAVQAGQSVDPGQVIGYVGSTGNSTGPHLHLEVRPGGGSPVDPFQALVDHGVQP